MVGEVGPPAVACGQPDLPVATDPGVLVAVAELVVMPGWCTRRLLAPRGTGSDEPPKAPGLFGKVRAADDVRFRDAGDGVWLHVGADWTVGADWPGDMVGNRDETCAERKGVGKHWVPKMVV